MYVPYDPEWPTCKCLSLNYPISNTRAHPERGGGLYLEDQYTKAAGYVVAYICNAFSAVILRPCGWG